MIWKWLKKQPTIDADVDAAKKALEESQGRRGEVEELVIELRERRLRNQFAPSLEAALNAGVHRRN